MTRSIDLYAEAIRLHEEHARLARARGDEVMARHSEEQAELARQRFDQALERERLWRARQSAARSRA